jgi:phage terminase large subunit-like protein
MKLEDRAAAEQIIRELERRKQRTKIDTFFPTPENRAGYPVHMEFFKAGSTYRQRLALAANRVGKCVSGETLIDNPYGNPRPVKEITGPHWIWAWDGKRKVPALAEKPFAKNPQRLYRIFLQDGRWIDCALEHRFLTESGWLFLDDLLQFVPFLPSSNSGLCPLVSLSDVRYYLQRFPNYQDRYQSEHHSCGVQLLPVTSNVQVSFPSLGDALKRTLSWLHSDDLVGKCKYNLSELHDHLSSFYEILQKLVQVSVLENHNAYNFCTPNLHLHQEFLLSHAEEVYRQQQSFSKFRSQENGTFSLLSPDGGENKVIACQPIGIDYLYDFTVPEFGNYCTLGTINHNTEGMGGYETVLHLTGKYPDWWKGKRFNQPVSWWIGGDTSTTVRDIIQYKLLGKVGEFGTGLIPGDLLIDTTNKRGVPDGVENIYVKHISGGRSVAQLKSYDQGREAWQGTEQHGVWMDEEPPMSIYTEALTRTMTTGGLVLCTFTPMNGMTEVTESFLSPDKPDSKFMCTASWDDALHLDEATKKEMLEQYPLHERDARSKGIPTLGTGRIYPVDIESMLVDPFELPKHWVRGYALDVGWNKTAALWGALDRDSDTLYLYSEHYQGMSEPAVHASAIKARGDMTGYIDPAAKCGSQADGEKLIQLYRNEGLKLAVADNAKEAGIYDVYQRMTSGRIKIFRTLINLQKELPLYHRDGNGAIVKKNDHLLDCMRYLCRATPVLSYATEKTGHYSMTQSGVQYRTSRPTRGNRYGG